MKRLSFSTDIQAPAHQVYTIMLGLKNKRSYEAWTALFGSGSTYEGTWEKGSRIRFVGLDANGKKGGMVSVVDEHIPAKFVSIRHIGIVDGDKEITEGPETEAWAGGLENYTFEDHGDGCRLTVETDTTEEFEAFFTAGWPKALDQIKHQAERSGE
jgi:hypothetical protein